MIMFLSGLLCTIGMWLYSAGMWTHNSDEVIAGVVPLSIGILLIVMYGKPIVS
jgi:hypothetical protein